MSWADAEEVARGERGRIMTEPRGREFSGRTGSSFSLGTARMTSVGHLTTEAIAAYVDGELRMGPHLRAAAHLGGCPDCAGEVDAQRRIRADLQRCENLAAPDSLLGSLRSIPFCPGPHDGAGPADAQRDGEGRGKARWRWPF